MAVNLRYRPCLEATLHLPFGVRSAGRYIVRPPWEERPMQKFFVQVYWGVRGRGELALPGYRRTLGPGQVALYLPGDTHAIRALDGEWEYAWWTMDGPMATDVVRGFGFDGRLPRDAGRLPEERFATLFERVSSTARADEIANCQIAYELLACAAGVMGNRVPESEPSLAEQCRRLFDAEFENPDTGVKTAAVRLGTDRSYLCRAFRKECGIPPKTYLSRLRISKALALLRNTDMPVAEAARASGFDSPSYFASIIHGLTGYPPVEFRAQFGGR